MSTSEIIPLSPRLIAIRILRGLALLGLTLGLTFIVDLVLLTAFPQMHKLFGGLIWGQHRPFDAGLPVALALIVLTPLILGSVARRLPMRSPRGRVYFGLAVISTLVVNLVVVASFPSVVGGFVSLTGTFLSKTYGLSLTMIVVTLAVLGFATWRLRSGSPRSFVFLALVVASVLVADLVLVAFCRPLFDEVSDLIWRFTDNADSEAASTLVLVLILVGLVPTVVFGALSRLRRHSWWWVGGGYLTLAPVFAYLATDDPVVRRPLTMEEISPAFSGAENSFEVLMRYGKNHPLGQTFRAPDRIWKHFKPGEALDPGNPGQWLAFLTAHQADIEADWADLAPMRTWWAELNAFDRIGDLTPTRFDAEIITFAPLRTMSQHGCAMASLQALAGHGDEAIDTLLPILQVARKLQPSDRTLVRQMIAIVMERMSVQTAGFILDHTAISPAARARLVAALAVPGGGPAGARRLVATEYVFTLRASLVRPVGDLLDVNSPWLRRSLNVVGPFVYNPHATMNLYGEFVADLQELIGNRQFDQIAARTARFSTEDIRPHFKNFLGRALLGISTPVFGKVGESYWKTQDLRAGLLARLTKT